MAALSALSWNYFFIPPRFTFFIRRPEDLIMFAMFFVVAISMGSLTSRLRLREEAERRRLKQTSALLRVTQSAALVAELDKGLADALRTINELLGGQTALVVREKDHSLPKDVHAASTFTPAPKEWGVIAWCFQHRQSAGRFTDTLPESQAIWFPLQTGTSTMGVMGVLLPRQASLEFTVRQTIEAFALQLALVLEKEHFIQAVSHAEVVARSESLHRLLLDSLAHELKTPLAVVQASLEGMADVSNPYLDEIRTASQRLQRVVNHFLQMSKVESELLCPRPDWCDVRDVLHAAQEAAGSPLQTQTVEVRIPENMPLLKLDAALLAQALANILNNAAVYAGSNKEIEIDARYSGGRLRISVRDHGHGLPGGQEGRVFDKFYRGPGAPAGGTGLGLAISRGLARAMGGDVHARNHPEGGAIFELAVPAERMEAEGA
jgi:two-component system sensor histidine kinase KdpD